MGSVPQPFELTMRLRNNLLKARRLELGMTGKQLSEQVNIHPAEYSAYETLRRSPLTDNGEWRGPAVRLANFFGVPPEELWPQAILDVAFPVVVRQLSEAQLRPILGMQASGVVHALPPPSQELAMELSEIREAMSCSGLTPNERRVLELRFGLDGDEMKLDEVAEKLQQEHEGSAPGQSRQWVSLLEARGLKKLRSWFDARNSNDILPDGPALEADAATTDREKALAARIRDSNNPDVAAAFEWTDQEKRYLIRRLHVYFCDSDVVIAKDAQQANRILRRKARPRKGPWRIMPYHERLSCRRAGRTVTRTCAQWVVSRGAGWFFALFPEKDT